MYVLCPSTVLQMSPCLLAKVVRGDVSTWSDPLIQKENPTSVFPANKISVVYCQNNTGDVQGEAPGGVVWGIQLQLLLPAW